MISAAKAHGAKVIAEAIRIPKMRTLADSILKDFGSDVGYDGNDPASEREGAMDMLKKLNEQWKGPQHVGWAASTIADMERREKNQTLGVKTDGRKSKRKTRSKRTEPDEPRDEVAVEQSAGEGSDS